GRSRLRVSPPQSLRRPVPSPLRRASERDRGAPDEERRELTDAGRRRGGCHMTEENLSDAETTRHSGDVASDLMRLAAADRGPHESRRKLSIYELLDPSDLLVGHGERRSRPSGAPAWDGHTG